MKTENAVVNRFRCKLPAKSVNEGFARGIVSAFCAYLDPTVEELCDVKTALSEAFTNAVVHAYKYETDEKKKTVVLEGTVDKNNLLVLRITDNGCGIEDIPHAMEPMVSLSGDEERSGMGFCVMQCFCNDVIVKSKVGKGTRVILKKYIGLHG